MHKEVRHIYCCLLKQVSQYGITTYDDRLMFAHFALTILTKNSVRLREILGSHR